MKTKLGTSLLQLLSNGISAIMKKKNKTSVSKPTTYLEKLPGGAIIDKRLYAELSKSNPDHVMIHWNNLNGSSGFIFVMGDDKHEKLFAAGKSGSTEVKWIQNGKSYEFNLYDDADRKKP
ncbi:MAG: hypothetical protein K2Q34_00425, partial [Alphaproteobacteria bacterium]|nr:hypothetical protein [Alphaproteobacteria bacterium]